MPIIMSVLFVTVLAAHSLLMSTTHLDGIKQSGRTTRSKVGFYSSEIVAWHNSFRSRQDAAPVNTVASNGRFLSSLENHYASSANPIPVGCNKSSTGYPHSLGCTRSWDSSATFLQNLRTEDLSLEHSRIVASSKQHCGMFEIEEGMVLRTCLSEPFNPFRETYLAFTALGNVNIRLQDIPGVNDAFDDFNFRTQPFKLLVDERLLSMINYGGRASYLLSDLTMTNGTDFAQVSVARHFADRIDACVIVPSSVFAQMRIDRSTMESGGTVLDLSSQPAGDIYLFKDEVRDRFAKSNQSCYPSVHSSRRTRWGAVVAAPTFSGYPYAYDGYSNTYGNGAYVYVNATGDLYFRYQTQRQQSRVVFLVGIFAEN